MTRSLPLLVALLTLPTSASALTGPRHGAYVDAAGGLALHTPLEVGPGWQVGAGWWWGPYDEAYAIGSFTSLGVSVRQEWLDDTLITAPGLELRRGWDLLVIKPYLFVAAAPEFAASDVGVRATVGAGAKWRLDPKFGAIARIEAGGAWNDDPGARVELVLGFEWSGPMDGAARSAAVAPPGASR